MAWRGEKHTGKKGHSPGEEKMSKLKLITLAASTMLAITFTISCSDDKDENKGGGWLSCPEAEKIRGECLAKGDPKDIKNCIISSGMCNGITDMSICQDHYNEECNWTKQN
jgi:hypothetical protein